MSFYNSLKLLRIYFPLNFNLLEEKLPEFFKAKDIYYYYHFPFLIHFPLIIISPYFLFRLINTNLNFKFLLYSYILPLVIYFLYIFYSIAFDKLQYYSISPSLNQKNQYFSLKSSIVATANLILFVLHPAIGWIFLFFSIIYCYFISLFLWSKYYKKRFLKTLSESLLLISLFILFFIIILFINNIIQSYKMLKEFGIL